MAVTTVVIPRPGEMVYLLRLAGSTDVVLPIHAVNSLALSDVPGTPPVFNITLKIQSPALKSPISADVQVVAGNLPSDQDGDPANAVSWQIVENFAKRVAALP